MTGRRTWVRCKDLRSVIETLPPRPKIRILSWHIAPSVVISGWISDVFISSSTALHKTLKIEMCILIFAILFTYKRMLILFLSVSYHLRSHPFFILFLSFFYPFAILWRSHSYSNSLLSFDDPILFLTGEGLRAIETK